MGWFKKLKNSVEKEIEKAAKAVAAPVGAAVGKVKNTIVNIWEGFFGSPTDPGGTNWNAYSHEQLRAMLHTQASPGQVGHQSTLADTMAATSKNCVSQLQTKHQNMPDYWRGNASESAKVVLDRHSSGWTETSEFATSLSEVLESAAAALSHAQRAMPDPLPVDSITVAGAATGAAAGSTLGPAGALAGAVLGAGASKFGASAAAANRKAEAVEVMQSYERALRSSLDGVRTPTQRPPQLGVDPHDDTGALRGGNAFSPGGGAMAPGAGARPGMTTGSNAGTSANTSRVGGAPANLDPSSGRSAASTIAAASAQPVSFPATGLDGRPVGGPTPWRELVGRGGTPDLLGLGPGAGREPGGAAARSVRGGPATGGRGAPGAPGMFATPGGARGRQEEDTEHHYKLPYNEKLFGIDEKPTPPVIGA